MISTKFTKHSDSDKQVEYLFERSLATELWQKKNWIAGGALLLAVLAAIVLATQS